MHNLDIQLAVLGVILLAGVGLNRFSRFLKMPILLCFLAVGMLGGRYGLGLLPPEMKMSNVQLFGEVALCFIIFSGGLQTSYRSIKSVFTTGTLLSTVGVVLTALIVGAFVWMFSRISLFVAISFPMALLVGAIFSSTDAAAVFAILRGRGAAIPPKLQSLLEYESGSNDPAAFLLTSLLLGILSAHESIDVMGFSWSIARGIVWGLGVGAAIGLLFGVFGQWFFNWIQSFLEYNGLRFVVAIALVLLCYSCTNAAFHANPLMSCYVAGITMGNLKFNFKQIFIKFQDGISWLMQLVLFTLLGSFFDFHMFFNMRNMVGAILCSITLMFIARPAVVLLCMIKSPFSMRERLFTSWVGIRGSAPIMLAAMVIAAAPEERAIPVQNLFYLVFTVVLLSILLQGSSLMWVAKLLGLVKPYQAEVSSPLEYEAQSRTDIREMHNFLISQNNAIVGQTLGNSGLLTTGAVLLTFKRDEHFIRPEAEIVLRAGDELSFLGMPPDISTLQERYFPDAPYLPERTFRQVWFDIIRKFRVKHQPKNV